MKMPCSITDGPQSDDNDREENYCHAHGTAFADFCQFCDEEAMVELRRDYEREVADETVAVLREIGGL